MNDSQHKKTFNESIQEIKQALRQIGAIYVESVLSLLQLIKRDQKKASK